MNADLAFRTPFSYHAAPFAALRDRHDAMFRRLFIAAVLATGSCAAHAELTAADAVPGFVVALRAYDAGDYARAAQLLEAVTTVAPDCARCVHLLGRSYGRLAERAGWIDAMNLARKTVDALEHAVELAPSALLPRRARVPRRWRGQGPRHRATSSRRRPDRLAARRPDMRASRVANHARRSPSPFDAAGNLPGADAHAARSRALQARYERRRGRRA